LTLDCARNQVHPPAMGRSQGQLVRTSEVSYAGSPTITTAMAAWRGGFVIPSGEIRPGVRSPEVWFLENK